MLETVVGRSVGFLDEPALVQRLLDHIDRDTTDLADGTWRVPVQHYRSSERLQREVRDVLRRLPVAFCPSAALPEPGSYVARAAAGVPIVAVRDNDGTVRAFRNACRHRGTAVVSGHGCERSLVCPFHGWVYRLDGALRHVPDEHGFPDLDRATHGLVPVLATERHGLVFVNQDGSPAEEAVLDSLPELVAPSLQLLGHGESVVEANWKVFTEGFLEGYHIKATHRTTFFPFGFDNVNVVETSGCHSRITFPFRRIEALRDVPPAERRIGSAATVVTHLFPNVIVARLSHHTSVAVMEPETIDRTRLVTYLLGDAPPASHGGDDAERRDAARRDTEFVELGAREDREMACAVQRGLSSGANELLELGRFEGALIHFHRQLAELLGDAENGPGGAQRP